MKSDTNNSPLVLATNGPPAHEGAGHGEFSRLIAAYPVTWHRRAEAKPINSSTSTKVPLPYGDGSNIVEVLTEHWAKSALPKAVVMRRAFLKALGSSLRGFNVDGSRR